jgi:hypothetical protein
LLDANYDAIPASALKQQMLASIQAPAAAAPGFGISVTASALSVTQGSTGSETVTVAGTDGFAGRVNFYFVGLPAGVTASFAANPTATSSAITITAASTAAPGNYSIGIIGYSGSLTAQTPIALTIAAPVTPSFTLAPTTSALSVTQGKSVSDTIAVARAGGFTGNATLAVSGLPAGVTAAFASNPAAASSTVTFTASASAAPGTYPVTIAGTSGSLTAKTSISLIVAAPVTSGFACHVGYSINSQYPGGFGATVTINNTGTTSISNWTLTWTFANGQTVTQLWNGTETQSGSSVTVKSMSYNGTIAAGGSYTGMGFNGSWNNATNAIPTSFAVNGTVCK